MARENTIEEWCWVSFTRLWTFLFLISVFLTGCSADEESKAQKNDQGEVAQSSEEGAGGSSDSGLAKPEPFDPEPKPAVPKPFNPKPKPAIPKPFVPPKPPVPDVKILQPSKDETVIRIPDKVLFDFDSSRLRPEAYPVLEEIAKSLNNSEGYEVKIEGHTDSRGSDEYNIKLSKERAEAVRKALIDRYGVSPDILTAEGLGEREPVAPNDTEKNRQKNRRVEITVQPKE
jgi:outer membrane protein OmpA-like peptidoglycan-associated protein